LGDNDGVAVTRGTTAEDAKVLVGVKVGATDVLHPAKDASSTRSSKREYKQVFILRPSFYRFPATASAITPGILAAIYRDLATPAR
jgi:hypothetical protein